MTRRKHNVHDVRRSIVQVRIGNRTYDAVYEKKCSTCRHPARMLIEEKILQNYPFRAIAEQFSERVIDGEDGHPTTLPKISYQSIHQHFQHGHMPLEAATLRRLADRRSKQIGAAYDEAADRFVDHVVLAEATVARTYDRMMRGEIEPDVKEGIAAAKMLADLESGTQAGLDAEAWSEAMMIYFEEARKVMAADQWGRFTRALADNPILRALERRLAPSDPNVIDAEPVAIEGAAAS